MDDNELEELVITPYNTINNKYLDEMSIKDFFEKFKKNKDKNNYDLKYDSENKVFIIRYGGYVRYVLKLDKIAIENYELGKYNDITYELKQLVDYYDKKRIEEEKENQEQEEYDDIIERAEKGEKLSSLKEIETYYNYLKYTDKKITYSQLIKILEGIVSIGLIGLGFFFVAKGYVLGFLPLLGGMVAIMDAGFRTDETIKEAIKKVKINKKKMKQLEEELKLSKIKSVNLEKFDKTIEDPVKEDLNEFTNIVMKNFNDILNRLNYLNEKDRDRLLTKTQMLMDEYIERYRSIIFKSKGKKLVLDKENLEQLKLDITRKLSDIETEMNDIRDNDVELEQILREKSLLDDKIKKSYSNTEAEGKTAVGKR